MAKRDRIEMFLVFVNENTVITGISYPPRGSQKEPKENQVRLARDAFANTLTGKPYSELVKKAYKWIGPVSAQYTASLCKGYVESCSVEVGKDPYG